jgi:phosphopantothenoylcysteine decarboxylase/phosphopantothenate--cysteine ligase
VHVESAREMLAAVESALPADIAIFAAAVADWRVADAAGQKMKKDGGKPPSLALVENPDILATVARARPIGRPWSSASQPRRRTSSTMPAPSSRRRAAT